MEFGVVKKVWLASILSSSLEIFLTLCKKCEKTNYAFGKGRGAKNIKVRVVHEHLTPQRHKEVAWVKKKGWKTLIKGIHQVNKYVDECVLNFMKVTYLGHN
jgi:hypothetical protein